MEGCWNKNNMKWEHVRKEHMIHKTRCNTKNKQRLMHGVEEVVSLVAGRRDEVWGKKKRPTWIAVGMRYYVGHCD